MLADHDAIRAAEQQRIERLVGALILQQAVDMDAGFVGEDVVSDNGLVERNGARGRRGDQRTLGDKRSRCGPFVCVSGVRALARGHRDRAPHILCQFDPSHFHY